jgi:hypothetical protein
VQAASRIGLRLTRLVGLREQGPARLAVATELRLRAYTLVVRTYQEARSAISYLRRREEDVEAIAPSLFSGRTRKKPIDGETDATQAPAGTIVPAVNTHGTTPPVVTAPVVPGGAPAVPASLQNGSVASKGPFL